MIKFNWFLHSCKCLPVNTFLSTRRLQSNVQFYFCARSLWLSPCFDLFHSFYLLRFHIV